MLARERVGPRREERAGPAAPRFVRPDAAGDPPHFVRRLVEPPKVLDLLDIVAGGNGTGHRREHGIDPVTGMDDPRSSTSIAAAATANTAPVTWHKLIDGVFIPDGRAGAGAARFGRARLRRVSARPDGTTYGSIWARAADVEVREAANEGGIGSTPSAAASSSCPRAAACWASAPTRASRSTSRPCGKMYQDVRPARFRAIGGLVRCPLPLPAGRRLADLWVFVDGQLKFNRMHLRPQDGAVKMDVELGPSDRFLTLVSTDGGNGDILRLGCLWRPRAGNGFEPRDRQ